MGLSDTRSSLPNRVSQVPRLFFRRTLSPTTPKSQTVALPLLFTVRAGFIISDRLAALSWRNEAVPGSLALWLTALSQRGFAELDYSFLRSLDYVSLRLFTRQTPFSLLEQPGLSWRT
jgi:hypothetical protein